MYVFIYCSVALLQSGTAMWVMPVIYYDNSDVFLMNFGPNGREGGCEILTSEFFFMRSDFHPMKRVMAS